MAWTYDHDILLCREILVEEPYKFKAGTRDRGQAWEKIANNLNQNNADCRFIVNQRGVRDRYTILEKAFRKKMAAEERASGITTESTELDQAIESIIGRSEGAQAEIARSDDSRKKQMEAEKETAESIRKVAMERLAETREREIVEGSRKRRRGGVEILQMEFLKEKSGKEMDCRRDELEMRKKEIELRERELILREREQSERERKDERILAMLAEQQRQQQALIAQLQQQMQAILALIGNKNN